MKKRYKGHWITKIGNQYIVDDLFDKPFPSMTKAKEFIRIGW